MAQPQARRSEPGDPQLLALKVPPHSVEAEQSLLGGLLLDNHAFDKIADLVTAEDFYRDDHRRIYRHIAKLIEQAKPADMVTVGESIEASEDKDRTGGLAYLGSLAQNTPSALNIGATRSSCASARCSGASCRSPPRSPNRRSAPSGKDVAQLLDEAETRILEVGEKGQRGTQGFESIQPVLARVFERIDHLYQQDVKSDVTGVPTGFLDLDEKTAGLQPGDLIIVAGRPSMGKTALA
jgi:replicative DNA helicase